MSRHGQFFNTKLVGGKSSAVGETNLRERAPFRDRELLLASVILSLRGVLVPSPSSSRAPRLLLLDELFWSAVPESRAPRLRRPFSYIERGA